MVGAPRLHIAYALHLGEAGLDGIVEEAVPLGVMVALVRVVLQVEVVVLIAYLHIGNAEGLGVSVGCAHLAIAARHGSVGIFQGRQALIYPSLKAVDGCATAVPDAHVDHIEGFGTQVLAQLQVLVETESVG